MALSFNTLWIYTALKHIKGSDNWVYVSIPSEFTLLSNVQRNADVKRRFQYPLNLHCSQTWAGGGVLLWQFQYPLNLHCSQTEKFTMREDIGFNTLWIYTALKPGTSEAGTIAGFNTLWIYTALKRHSIHNMKYTGFNTLWIYTALKRLYCTFPSLTVSIPSEFTLLSNCCPAFSGNIKVSIPSEFTLLSNVKNSLSINSLFQYPLNLHCSQTL